MLVILCKYDACIKNDNNNNNNNNEKINKSIKIKEGRINKLKQIRQMFGVYKPA